ncbi:hypothetical protein FEM48_Zijuj07G0094800 [Ziziphus jujuba var. spinosa]|uniref:Tuberculostearic acid methyltransferase UfaA1-like n=1 Tax=Ziziphus jujuba var. spinosa TaxID=714518 RepID=A0A978V3U8_ZIZJJ|nr:hypothetical protein FEM48_Zijuj07G0094800 [Ziziphus jujuba var. spinosa]
MTQAELGFADAYVNGDCSFVDEDEGLLNFFRICIANRDASCSVSILNKKRLRGWWTPLLITASLSSAKFFFQHVTWPNTPTQARRNICHYDLTSELFAFLLGETMQYFCAIFKTKDEDLKSAQKRKISILIEKARIEKKHEALEIGFGWGIFAIELVKQTGCKYTGITLSEEQLHFAQKKVAEAGLQDNIKFLLCDYCQFPNNSKYDRIISVRWDCCSTAMPDERYEEYRQSSDFIKEYIFPGACVASLSRVTSAMAASSRLRESLVHGFNEKFIPTWEYYFDYSAAGFETHTLNDYQMVFSSPGNANVNVAAFNDP